MLTLILKNETTNSYDSIRRAMKAAYKDSAAYRMRQIEFDDSLKSSNTLQMKIGEYKALNLQLTCVITDVKQLSMVITDLLEEAPKKPKKNPPRFEPAEPKDVGDPSDPDMEKLLSDSERVVEAVPETPPIGEGAIIQSTETA